MQLTPRYDDPSFLVLDLDLGDPAVPLLRQRRRFEAALRDLDDEQWATASRCDGWSVRDVVAHLVSTNQFWTFTVDSARRGEPSRFLATFDPVATPASLVDGTRGQSPAEVLDHFVESNAALAAVVADLGPDDWTTLGEAPPGHLPLAGVALHALWDSWVHERDVLLPLGLEPRAEVDEITGCLVYSAALSPAFSVAGGSTRAGSIAVEATAPSVELVIEVARSVTVHTGTVPADALHLRGSAVELVEGLSFRAPLPGPVGDEHRWLLGGLAEVFDRDT